MKTVFVLIVLFTPPNDGLIMGWAHAYDTQLQCEEAKAQAIVQAGHSSKVLMGVTCQVGKRP